MDVDFTEKLIQEVRNRPILYLQSHPDYKNNKKKFQAWREIQRELNEEVAALKSKWKNLKDTYKKYKQSRDSNSCLATKKLHNWVWADHMSFTDPGVSVFKTYEDEDPTNMDETTQDSAQETQELQERETPETQTQRRLKRNNVEPIERIYIQKKRERNVQDGLVDVKCDGVDLLFLGYADTYKKLSKRKQVKFKFEMAKAMMEAEMGDLESSERYCYSVMEGVPRETFEEEAQDTDEHYCHVPQDSKPIVGDNYNKS